MGNRALAKDGWHLLADDENRLRMATYYRKLLGLAITFQPTVLWARRADEYFGSVTEVGSSRSVLATAIADREEVVEVDMEALQREIEEECRLEFELQREVSSKRGGKPQGQRISVSESWPTHAPPGR